MAPPTPEITYVRDIRGFDDSRQAHADGVRAGREVRLARGAYVPTAPWLDLDARQRYLMTVRAVARTRRHDMVLSHWSAAAIHGLPVVGRWPEGVHVSIGRVSGGRSRRGVAKHALVVRDDEMIEVHGMLVTSVARTVVDLAVSADRRTAIATADRALLVDPFGRTNPLATRDELWEAYSARGNFRGRGRARDIIEFASTGAESPLESVSRWNMRAMNCPPPEVQREFRDHAGVIGRVDFYWDQHGLVGEADGDAKYLDSALRGGLTAAEVVLAEKRREDRIRALGPRVTRWPWAVGVDAQALRWHLQRAGLPIP